MELPLPAEEPEAPSLVSVRGADDICSTEASAEVASSVVFVGLGEQEGWDRGKKDRGTEDRREDQGRKEDEAIRSGPVPLAGDMKEQVDIS